MRVQVIDLLALHKIDSAFDFTFQAIGHISGGHLNPAVTTAMLITGKISFVRALLYVVIQCAGAVAGTASLKSLLPEIYHNGLGHTTLSVEVTPVQGLGIEFFLGFILIFTIFGVCDDNKAGKFEVLGKLGGIS